VRWAARTRGTVGESADLGAGVPETATQGV
jgi:hypothetical protein